MSETISPTFTFVKDGVFYFSRRIPKELSRHYSSPRIAFSLRTRSARVAEARARKAADQLDEYWFVLRSQEAEMPGKHLLRLGAFGSPSLGTDPTTPSSSFVLLSEAVEIYLHQKAKGRPVTFRRAAERACGYVIDACGDKHLDVYTKADANAFRDALISRGLAGSSMTRVFGTIRAVTNFAASEQGLTFSNPFAGVYYDRTAGVSDRNSIPKEALAVIQRKCRDADDDLRWLVAMVSDTGMRLAEAAGLALDDICEHEDGALVARVRPHPWRRLKTKGSERDVPLEGEARWAALRLLEQPSVSRFAFPRYNSNLTVRVMDRGSGKTAWWSNGEALAQEVAKLIDCKPGKEWLVIYHKGVNGGAIPDQIMGLLSSNPSRVHFLNWGKHQGTNEFRHIRNVIIAGLNNHPETDYELKARYYGEIPNDQDVPKNLVEDMQAGEHKHHILQALCRSELRQGTGLDCGPCNAYIIAPKRSRVRHLLPQVFPGCKVGTWKPTKKRAKGKVQEALAYAQNYFEGCPGGVLPFAELRSVLGYDASNFRNRIRNHDSFKAGLEESGIEEVIHGNGRHYNALAKVTQPFDPLEAAEYIADV